MDPTFARYAFKPQPNPAGGATGLGATLVIASSTAQAGADRNLSNALAYDPAYNQLELQNDGTTTIYVQLGPAGVNNAAVPAAGASSFPVLGGQRKVITIGQEVTTIKTIMVTGTANLFVTRGQGIG